MKLIIIKIYLYGKLFTVCYLCNKGIVLPSSKVYTSLGLQNVPEPELPETSKCSNAKSLCYVSNTYFLRPFIKVCIESSTYRRNFLQNIYKLCGNVNDDAPRRIKLKLESPDTEIIDYMWNERILKLVWTRVEIEHAFSWLSTLGGAYSALGDYFVECAEEAGRISIRQYKLSKVLGDESLAARSRLYSALSFSQKGKLKKARHVVRNVVNFACETKDRRLYRMCQGVWTKLKYLRILQKQSKMKPVIIG